VCVSRPNDLKARYCKFGVCGMGRRDPRAKLWGSKYCGVIV
jgi:hypothetical protein